VGKLEVKEFRAGQWHEFRVLVEGNRHRHWIDGHQTVDVIDLDEKGRKLEGVLGMQVHVGPRMTVEMAKPGERNASLDPARLRVRRGSIRRCPARRLPVCC